MNYDPAELETLLSQPWSNGACRGYVIMAMENCGFSSDDIYKMSRPNVQKILYKNVQLVCLS